MAIMDKLMDFVEKAITDRKEGNHTYKVFIGRTLCSAIQIYMDQHKVSEIDRKKIVFENGARIVAQKMAEEFVSFKGQPKDFPIRVEIYTDFVVYGENQAGIFSECEEIFSNTVERMSKNDYGKEELYNVFWDNVSIYSLNRNKSSNLFKPRYQKQFDKQYNYLDRRELNREIYEVSEQIYSRQLVTEINAPALKLKQGDKDLIARRFMGKYKIGDMERVRNTYRSRNIDSYIACKKKNNDLKVVYSLRATEKYLIPWIFLPILSEKQLYAIADSLSEKINNSINNSVLEIKKMEWVYLPNEYFRLVYSTLNALYLRAFVEEIDFELKDTTVDFIMYNYAHDKEIESLFKDIFNPKTACIFSLKEVQNIIECEIDKSAIFLNASDIISFQKEQESKKTVEEIHKVEEKIEKTIFNFSVRTVEKRSYNQLSTYLLPSYGLMNYMEYPYNEILGNIFQGIYCYHDSWIRNAISIEKLVSYLLQLIDLVGLDTRFFKKDDGYYVECIKFNTFSKTILIYRYAQYLPLLEQIQWRCRRQGRNTISGLWHEYVDFLKKFKNYIKESKCPDYSTLDDIKSQSLRFYYMVYGLHKVGILIDEYIFLVEKKLSDLEVSVSSRAYIASWKDLYIDVVY